MREILITIIPTVIVIDIMTIIFIVKDCVYFFDEEKPKLIMIVLFLPIVGVVYILMRLRDDIKWYVGASIVVLAFTCSGANNRLDFYFCMKILSKLEKVLHF